MASVRLDDEVHRKLKRFLETRIGGIGEWVSRLVAEGITREKKRRRRRRSR